MHLLHRAASRLFHRYNCEDLKQMILHHIFQGAAVIIISAPGLYSHFFQCRYLDTLDMPGIPDIAEYGIGKPDRLYIPDHFLSKIMINPIDMVRPKKRFHCHI